MHLIMLWLMMKIVIKYIINNKDDIVKIIVAAKGEQFDETIITIILE